MTDHTIERLFVRREKGAAVEERDQLTVETSKGVVDDHTFGRMRRLTPHASRLIPPS